MSERITIGVKLTMAGREDLSEAGKIEFLREVFEISHKRAQSLVNRLNSDGVLMLNVTFRQLARYVAYRVVNAEKVGMTCRRYLWQYPRIESVVEHVEEEPMQPIELRPNYRRVP